MDYSSCSTAELQVAKELLIGFGENQAGEMQKDDFASKISGASYVGMAKGSLALVQQELQKR